MKFLTLFIFFFSSITFGQNIEAYQIYNKNGRKISTKRFLKKLMDYDVVLFGELHNNPISHWLELESAKYLSKEKQLTLGAEMFEANQQAYINQYLNNEITQEELDSLTQLWPNYPTDYKPLLDLAKQNNLPFIATNVPRKYASYVYRNGLEALEQNTSDNEKKWIAPLPIAYDPELPGYKHMMTMFEGSGHSANPNLPKAQAIKDATMAHFIAQNIADSTNQIFLHFNGDYHSKNFEGIHWYLKKWKPQIHIGTISTVEQSNTNKLDPTFLQQADFIIVVDEDMTKTY